MDTRPGHTQLGRLGLFGLLACSGAIALSLLTVFWWRPLLLLDAQASWCRLRAGLSTHELVVGGDRWVYDERGGAGADTLVFVHGFAGSRRDWYPLLPSLPRNGRLILVDLPGWGDAGRKTHHDYRARAQARRLAQFLEAVDARHVHLVGHSMGGKITGIAATLQPARITRLTLVASAGLNANLNDFTRRLLAGEDPFNLNDHRDYERLLHDAFEQPPSLPRHVEDAIVADNRRDHLFNDYMLHELLRGEQRNALEPALLRLKMPVQAIWCRHDRILDVSAVDTVRRLLPSATIDIIEAGCGHMPMIEVPDTLSRLLVGRAVTGVAAL